MSSCSRCFALFVSILLGSTLAFSQVTFTETTLFSHSPSTNGIAVADFNNDGILDLLTINHASLSFYKGLGGGKYASAVNQPLPQNLGPVLAADFSRHGTPDLAILSATGVTILIGNNNGTFKQGTNINIGGTPKSITMADFNSDHLPGLAVSGCTSSGTCFTKVFVGQGNGLFTLAATLQDGGGQVVSGDFNADGHQDLAVVSGNAIALYVGNGNGTFKTPILASLANVSSIAVGDFYNNRIQSLAALTGAFLGGGDFETTLFTLRFSNGALLVENQRVLQASTGIPYQQITAGDVNGDFKEDLVLVGFDVNGQLADYILGAGNGTFGPIHNAPADHEGLAFPLVRDLDGDSRHDIAMNWTDIFGTTSGVAALHNTSAFTNCTLPPAGQLSVHICAPASGQVVGQTFTFKGSGSALNGVAKRMELWIDGKKVAQNLEDQLRATVTLTRGSHVATFVVVDSFDHHVSGSVSFTSSF